MFSLKLNHVERQILIWFGIKMLYSDLKTSTFCKRKHCYLGVGGGGASEIRKVKLFSQKVVKHCKTFTASHTGLWPVLTRASEQISVNLLKIETSSLLKTSTTSKYFTSNLHICLQCLYSCTYSKPFFLLPVFIRAGNANTWAAFFEIHCMRSSSKFVTGLCLGCCNQKVSSTVLI